jgi:prepilin-type N-terminal cleavage/methylation domain-containing protein
LAKFSFFYCSQSNQLNLMSMSMNEKGFSLIELMIAVVVLGVALLALAQMQISALHTNFSARDMTVATTLAQDKIEELQGIVFDDPDLADTNPANNAAMTDPRITSFHPADHEDPNNPISETGGTAGVRRYTRLWNIADNTPLQGVKTVVAYVCWGEINPDTTLPRHRVVVTSMIGEE